MKNIFYNYFLEIEQKRREEALVLHKNCNYNTLHKNYILYLKTVTKEEELSDLSIGGLIKKLTEIKQRLPKNSENVRVVIRVESDEGVLFSQDKELAYVEWIEYFIESDDKCSSLAKCWARDLEWKMKNQPNGKDGKKALLLYNKLIKEV